MNDIRGKDLVIISNSVTSGKVRFDDLKRALIDRVPRIGGRFSHSIDLLMQIGFIDKLSDGTLVPLESGPVTVDQIAERILQNRSLASEFVAACGSLQRQSESKPNVIFNKSEISGRFIWFVLLLEELGVLFNYHSLNYHVARAWTERFLNFVHFGVSNRFRSNPPSRYLQEIQKNVEDGAKAEEFVLRFERRRLANHALVDWIEYVAIRDVGAGFDILSFNGREDCIPNRMIEVKSWVGKKRFYLSAKELEVAQSSSNCYFIYLVNRDAMNNEDYVPEIFEFHSSQFFDNTKNWIAVPDGWRIESAIGC